MEIDREYALSVLRDVRPVAGRREATGNRHEARFLESRRLVHEARAFFKQHLSPGDALMQRALTVLRQLYGTDDVNDM